MTDTVQGGELTLDQKKAINFKQFFFYVEAAFYL